MNSHGTPSRRTLWTGVLVVAAFLALTAAAVSAGPQPPRLVDVRVDATDPARVVLTFTDDPVAELSHASVTDRAGAPIASGAPVTASGRTLVARASATASGVSYHAVFGDGQVLTGAIPVHGRPSTTAAADGHAHGVDPVGAVLLVVDGLAVLVFFAALLRRPRVRHA
jgi:hypothetical protein